MYVSVADAVFFNSKVAVTVFFVGNPITDLFPHSLNHLHSKSVPLSIIRSATLL